MNFPLVSIIVILLLSGLAIFANNRLNPNGTLKTWVYVGIVIVAALFLLSVCGMLPFSPPPVSLR